MVFYKKQINIMGAFSYFKKNEKDNSTKSYWLDGCIVGTIIFYCINNACLLYTSDAADEEL
jgi:hypothetical protein